MTVKMQEIILSETRNVKLTAMVQAVGNEFEKVTKRPAVLIMPGGGYAMCSDREAEVVAYPYLDAGYHAFVLRYSVGENRKWPNPLNDYEQAMALLDENAETWKVYTDKIVVVGFSAGGHLAACAATMAQRKPAAAVLVYPALTKELVEACQPGMDMPVPLLCVDGNTAPCFLVAARDDTTVPISGILDFEQKLFLYGIQFESHIYAYGGHGFGPATPSVIGSSICSRIPNWVNDSISWLNDILGKVDISGMTAPKCPVHVNADHESVLSVHCTLGYLRTMKSAAKAISPIVALVDEVIKQRFDSSNHAAEIIDQMKLLDIMATLGQSEHKIEEIDKILREICNK